MDRTATEKMWLMGAGIVALVMTLVGYFFFISPQRDETSNGNDEIANVQLANIGLQSKIATLVAQSKNMAVYERQLAQARLALPSSSDMSEFLRSLQSVAASTSTAMTSVTLGNPVALSAPQATPSTPASSSSSPAAHAAAPAAAAVPTGIYSIAITTAVSGTRSAVSNFLTQLQSVQPRAVLVTAVAQSGSSPAATTTTKVGAGQVQLQLTMTAFVAPVATPATTSAAPTGTP